MTSAKLRAQCLSHPENTVLVTCYLQVEHEHPQLYGHAFATVWDYGENKGNSGPTISCKISLSDSIQVGWVTQLVVHKAVCRCYIATQLLQALKFHVLFSDVNIVGLASSHPASCNALAKYAGELMLLPSSYPDITANNTKLQISTMSIWTSFMKHQQTINFVTGATGHTRFHKVPQAYKLHKHIIQNNINI